MKVTETQPIKNTLPALPSKKLVCTKSLIYNFEPLSDEIKEYTEDNSCAVISAIFACKLREAITEQSRCRERAACALISCRCGSNSDHRDSLKFVQEVARFVTSCFFGGKKSMGGLKSC